MANTLSDNDIIEPQEDDYISYDGGVTWYLVGGKQIFRCDGTCEEPHNPHAHLAAYAQKENWWPNAWLISDHGNAHLMEY
jgi:hypothetical protein